MRDCLSGPASGATAMDPNRAENVVPDIYGVMKTNRNTQGQFSHLLWAVQVLENKTLKLYIIVCQL